MKHETCKLKRGDAVTLIFERKDIPADSGGYIVHVFPYDECESGFMVTTNFIKEPLDSHWYVKTEEKILYTEKEAEALVCKAWNDGYTTFDVNSQARRAARTTANDFWEENKKK